MTGNNDIQKYIGIILVSGAVMLTSGYGLLKHSENKKQKKDHEIEKQIITEKKNRCWQECKKRT